MARARTEPEEQSAAVDRGNDPSAQAEILTQYGPHQNAEELIAAHRESYDPEVIAAMRKQVNEEASEEIDLSEIDPEQGGEVLAATVRGDKIVYVAEGEDGRAYKGVQDFEGE